MWKGKVNHLEGSIDRCRKQIDDMVQQEQTIKSRERSKSTENYRQRVFDNGTGTTVEVSIKTKKPSSRSSENKKQSTRPGLSNDRNKNWDTLLSQDDDSEVISPPMKKVQSLPQQPKIKPPVLTKDVFAPSRSKAYRSLPPKSTKVPVESKRYAQKTLSSTNNKCDRNDQRLINRAASSADGVTMRKSQSTDKDIDNTENLNAITHQFPNRTLHVFLRELRSAVGVSNLYSANDIDLHKIIDDIEFVAANLHAPSSENKVLAGQTKLKQKELNSQTEPRSDKIATAELIQSQVVRQLQLELEKSLKLNDEYKSKLEEVVTECTVKDQAILDRNSKLEDMRKIVSRLTATNNDMLGILSSRVRLEESFKTLETANRNLMQELEKEKRQNLDLETLNGKNNKHIDHLQRVITELRGSMNLHNQDVEKVIEKNLAISNAGNGKASFGKEKVNPIDSTFATVDLELSSNHSSRGNSPLPTDPPNIDVLNMHKEDVSRIPPTDPATETVLFDQGTLPLPTENINTGIPNFQSEEYSRILPIDSTGETALFDHGKIPLFEDKDDDADSAIGNSESHPLPPRYSSTANKRTTKEPQHPSKLQFSSGDNGELPGAELSPIAMPKSQHISRPSLGQEIKKLHILSEEYKSMHNTATNIGDKHNYNSEKFRPATLNLSETADSQRLETTDNNVEGEQSTLLAPKNVQIHDRRRSQEELDRLKLHREQQHILLQQQRENAELDQKYKKIAEGHRIANQVKVSANNVDDKVHDFLSRMKNDEKFQISLSSPVDFENKTKNSKRPSTVQMNFTGTTNNGDEELDTVSLTESRFRQGLESSLEYSAASEN